MSKPTTNYQQLNSELEAILQKLESGEVDVDEALKLFERGQAVVAELERYLTTAENKVTQLKAKYGDG